ncbi:MAG: penicillin acylase family protein, partial [Gammaproteobacteria bacterium]
MNRIVMSLLAPFLLTPLMVALLTFIHIDAAVSADASEAPPTNPSDIKRLPDLHHSAWVDIKDHHRLKILAQTDHDLFYLWGYFHASDRFFQMDEPDCDTPGKRLTAAEKLLGSFFFVHQAQGGDSETAHGFPSSFEFLHNTFGEYLTSDFILRRVMDEVEDVQEESITKNRKRKSRLDQRLEQATAFSPEWFACFAHTPLHTRPVVLEMLREWSKHVIRDRGLKEEDVIHGIDIIVQNQLERVLNNVMPPSMFSRERPTPFPRYSLLGHLAIYSLNLVLLRVVLVKSDYHASLGHIGTHEDGTSPWEQLTFLWRSWFSLENLAALTGVICTKVEEG